MVDIQIKVGSEKVIKKNLYRKTIVLKKIMFRAITQNLLQLVKEIAEDTKTDSEVTVHSLPVLFWMKNR